MQFKPGGLGLSDHDDGWHGFSEECLPELGVDYPASDKHDMGHVGQAVDLCLRFSLWYWSEMIPELVYSDRTFLVALGQGVDSYTCVDCTRSLSSSSSQRHPIGHSSIGGLSRF